jgi:uncharacterized protein (DUF1501 family)
VECALAVIARVHAPLTRSLTSKETHVHRRQFLSHALIGTPLAAQCTRLFAAGRDAPRLLIVFLRGAYDAASLLVPVASSYYYEQRPNIAIARPGSAVNSAIPIDGDWGLHPALIDSMVPFFERRQLAFVPFAGTEDTSRSHFETQDSIELGQGSSAVRDYRTGFLNRLAQVLGSRDAIAFTDQLPLVMRGSLDVPNLALGNLAKPGVDARQADLIARMYGKSVLGDSVREGFEVRDEAQRSIDGRAAEPSMTGEMIAANRNAITAKGFEGEVRRIARLMRERYRIGFVDVGGWDTHVGQGAATGYLANRLAELGKGLAAYADEMGTAWGDSIVVVLSEFGRTFKENGNRGTDHGHGSVYWVLGGSVHGGRVIGEQRRVAPGMLFQNRDYPVLNEYRAMLGGLFTRMYGLQKRDVERVFPGAVSSELGLV